MPIDFTVQEITSKYGNPQFEMIVENFTGHRRTLRALVFLMAAQVERASMKISASWVVHADTDRVRLELGYGTHAEKREAFQVLTKVKQDLKKQNPPG